MLHASRQGRGRPLAEVRDPLVGGEECDAGAFEVVFDLDAVVGTACDSVDRLADDGVEVAALRRRRIEKFAYASVAGHRYIEFLVCPASTAKRRIRSTGLDIPVVGDDSRAGRQYRLAVRELTRDRERWILEVFV